MNFFRSIQIVAFFLLFTFHFSLAPAHAFTDVHPHQEIYESVDYFLQKGTLQDRGQFSSSTSIKQDLFWKLLLSEADEEYRVPDFDPEGFITEGQALKAILASKGIEAPKRVTPSFRSKVTGLAKRSNYFQYLEAAHASNILQEGDFQPFAPHRKLTRRKAVMWLYGFKKGGNIKESTVNPSRYLDRNPNRRGARLSGREGRRNTVNLKSKVTTKHLSVPDGKILEEVYEEILNRYRFGTDIDEAKKKAMINAAIAAMVEEMGDKYSSYIEPKEANKFKDTLNGNFEGIGAFVDMIDGKFTIVSPIKGSPSEKAGLLPGDIVDKVDGEAIEGKDIHNITSLIKGPSGTEVTLTIMREEASLEVTVTRGKITVPSLNLEWNKGVPVVGVHQFNRDTGVKLRTMIETEIMPKNPKGLILDFRNNPGGYLVAAVQVGEIFLRDGREIFSVEYKDNKQTYKASRTGPLVDMENVVVLQNKGSASASEIVASMLQDYERATIIGTASLGKGTVQNINNFQNGGLLKLTVAKWLSPKGRWIHEKGVIPDIEMEAQTVEERRDKIDKPLDRAVQHVLGNK